MHLELIFNNFGAFPARFTIFDENPLILAAKKHRIFNAKFLQLKEYIQSRVHDPVVSVTAVQELVARSSWRSVHAKVNEPKSGRK